MFLQKRIHSFLLVRQNAFTMQMEQLLILNWNGLKKRKQNELLKKNVWQKRLKKLLKKQKKQKIILIIPTLKKTMELRKVQLSNYGFSGTFG